MHESAEQHHQAVESRQQRRGRQSIGGAAPQNDVDVHQAVAHNGVGEGQRDQCQRKNDQALIGPDRPAGREGHDVEHDKGDDCRERPLGEPFALLPHDDVFPRRLGCRPEAQHRRAGEEVGPQQGVLDAIEDLAHVDQGPTGVDGPSGDQVMQRQQSGCGRIRPLGRPKACRGDKPGAREHETEVQENRRRQQRRPHVAPIDETVEPLEFARVTEGVENERAETENVEVANHGPRRPPREDEGSDGKVSHGEQPLKVIDQRLFDPQGLDDQLGPEGRAAANQFVGGPAPDADPIECARDIDTVAGRQAADASQLVARLDAGTRSGPPGRNLKRPGAALGVDPPHAVVGQGKRVPLMVIHHGRPHQSDRGHHQQLGKNPGCKP